MWSSELSFGRAIGTSLFMLSLVVAHGCESSKKKSVRSDQPSDTTNAQINPADCVALNKILSEDGKSCVDKFVLGEPTALTQADCDKTNQILSADGKICMNKPGT